MSNPKSSKRRKNPSDETEATSVEIVEDEPFYYPQNPHILTSKDFPWSSMTPKAANRDERAPIHNRPVPKGHHLVSRWSQVAQEIAGFLDEQIIPFGGIELFGRTQDEKRSLSVTILVTVANVGSIPQAQIRTAARHVSTTYGKIKPLKKSLP